VAEATKKTLAANGMKVLAPSPKLVDDLNRLGRQMVDEWLAGAGADGKAVVEAFRK
jgi:hypothetical protein